LETATHPLLGGSAFTDEDEDAMNKITMLRRNTADIAPAPIAAIVVLGQFFNVCSMMLSARWTEKLALRYSL
jgi:hypothetical protein